MRLAADVVAAALGVNLWVALVLVPALASGATAHHPALVVMLPLPLLVLGGGLVRRSPVVLLCAYPAALLLPVAVDPRIVSAMASETWALPLAALSLIGFLLGASLLGLGGIGLALSPAPRTRRLAGSLGAEAPARWQRRRRVYTALAVLSALFPALLLYQVALSPTTRAFVSESYPEGRAPGLTALLLFGVLFLWLGLFATSFVGPLRRHRTGDQQLTAELDRLRLEVRQSTSRLSFYVAVVLALALMALLVSMRVGG